MARPELQVEVRRLLLVVRVPAAVRAAHRRPVGVVTGHALLPLLERRLQAPLERVQPRQVADAPPRVAEPSIPGG